MKPTDDVSQTSPRLKVVEDRAQGAAGTSGGPDTEIAPDLIEHLYEVAIDPERYEALLDKWEAMIAPQRAAANQSGKPGLGLREYVGHFNRADQVLDRVINDQPDETPKAMVSRIERTSAFAVDRSLTVIAVNTPAAAALGITSGAKLDQLALGPGEADELARLASRLIEGNSGAPVLMRAKSALRDHVIVLHLRLVRPQKGPLFIIALTSELMWPPTFGPMLKSAFELTDAEVEIVRGLTEGRSLTDIADQRGRSLETVRAQLKSVMSKTETRSQTELVRLSLSMMELTQTLDPSTSQVPSGSGDFKTLEKRPFHSMTLADGRRLDYLILGDPNGRPVLFLPLDYGLIRWPGPAETEATKRGLKIIVPVRAGYGASTSIPRGVPYVSQLTDDIAALLDHLELPPLPIISLGGDSFIAIALNAYHPGRITALIACAGVLPLSRPEQYERMDKWHRFILAGARYTPHLLPFMVKAGFALARRIGKRGFIHAVYGNSHADVTTFEIPEVFEAMVCGSEVALSENHTAHDAFAREVTAHETTDWSNEITILKSTIPVHFLNGLQDPQVPPGTVAEFQADYPWINFRVYPDAGQLLFFLKWRDVLAVVAPYVPNAPHPNR